MASVTELGRRLTLARSGSASVFPVIHICCITARRHSGNAKALTVVQSLFKCGALCHPIAQTPAMVVMHSSHPCRYGYEAELLELLEQLVRDMDRKIERQKERAAKDNAPRIPSATEQAQLDALQAREKGADLIITRVVLFVLSRSITCLR